MLILRFVERSLLRDLRYVIKRIRGDTLVSVFHLKLFSWIVPLAGAIILASPLPDEIGIAMMGFSHIKPSIFIPLSFFLNFLGILFIIFVAKEL